jgi:hypothetical protein
MDVNSQLHASDALAAPVTHRKENWVGSRVGLDDAEKGKNSFTFPGITPLIPLLSHLQCRCYTGRPTAAIPNKCSNLLLVFLSASIHNGQCPDSQKFL